MAATIAGVRAWLPEGNTLDDEAFAERHRLLRVLLGLHVPALAAFALLQGVSPAGAAAAVVLPAVCVFAASLFGTRRVQALFTTAGLLWCSAALVHLSGGMVEAHFHFFVVVGLVALYQDWPPFLAAVGFSVLSNGAAGLIDSDAVYNHPAGQANPLLWAGIEGVALVAASGAQVLFWRLTERSQAKAAALAADLVYAEEQSARRASVSELFVNLARRNQSLLDRQLALIDDLEQGERDPDALAELFKLDHLATRIRRNAESLLVLSGEEPSRRWGAPVALAEVARAAVAEVEDYNRAVIAIDEGVAVSGRAVADLAHLLAELVENATTFSPPTMNVQIRGRRTSDGRCLMTIEDRGIGMAVDERTAVNARLASPPEADVELDRRLGFRVVSRLAARYGVRVALAETPGGGITAVVEIPADLVAAPGGSMVGVMAAPTAPPPAVVAPPEPAPSVPAPVAAVTSLPERVVEPVVHTPLPTRVPAAHAPVEPGLAVPVAPSSTRMPDVVTSPAPVVSEPAVPTPVAPAPVAAALPPLPTRQPAMPPSAVPQAVPTPPSSPNSEGISLPKRTPAATSWPAPPRPSVAGGLPQRDGAKPVVPGIGGDAAKPAAARTPEQARLLLSRFQSGQVAGRTAADARRDTLAVSATTPAPTTVEEDR